MLERRYGGGDQHIQLSRSGECCIGDPGPSIEKQPRSKKFIHTTKHKTSVHRPNLGIVDGLRGPAQRPHHHRMVLGVLRLEDSEQVVQLCELTPIERHTDGY